MDPEHIEKRIKHTNESPLPLSKYDHNGDFKDIMPMIMDFCGQTFAMTQEEWLGAQSRWTKDPQLGGLEELFTSQARLFILMTGTCKKWYMYRWKYERNLKQRIYWIVQTQTVDTKVFDPVCDRD
jgi:hypothetical protein